MAKGFKTGGRKKGTPNKVTASVRETFQVAFESLQTDDHANLLTWARSQPTEFYKLAAKLIPIATEVTGKDGEPLMALDDNQTAAKLAAILAAAKSRKDETG